MADANQTIAQIAATRAAATNSSAQVNGVLNQELAKPISDPAVMAACQDTITQNDATIQKCDQDIVTAILAKADADAWLATLNGYTTQMTAQTAALTDDINALNEAKTVATEIAGMLSLL
jgi:hypothetical protein